jgi:hypothetical protein
MTIEAIVDDTRAVPRTWAILALRYFHRNLIEFSQTESWDSDSWLQNYADHLPDIPVLAHRGTDELWCRVAATGAWQPATSANASIASAALDSMLRTILSKVVRRVTSERGSIKDWLVPASPTLISNITREMATVLKSHGRTITDLSIQSLTPGKPLPCPAKRILPCANGMLDVVTRKLHPYVHDIFVPSVFPTSYNPAQAPHLNGWVWLANTRDSIRQETDGQMTLLQELMGYAMGFDRSIRGAIAFRGVSGSGKGSTLSLLQKTVGDAFQTFTLRALGTDTEVGRSAIIQKCVGSRIMADLDAVSPATLRSQSLTADIKTLSDFEDVTWRLSRAPETSVVRWQSMMIMATNELVPRWTDTSAAIAERFHTIVFDHGTDARRWETGVGEDSEYRDSLRTDPKHSELFLLWAADGLARVLSKGQFTTTDISEKQRKATKLHVVPIETWINDQIEFTNDSSDFIPTRCILSALWGWLYDHEVSFAKVKTALQAVPRMLIESGAHRQKDVLKTQRRLGSHQPASSLDGNPQIRGMTGMRFRNPPDLSQQWEAFESLDVTSIRLLGLAVNGRVPTSFSEFAMILGHPTTNSPDLPPLRVVK